MLALTKARATCPHCDRHFHQIDSTPERAAQVVNDACAAHVRDEHGGADQ